MYYSKALLGSVAIRSTLFYFRQHMLANVEQHGGQCRM